MLPSESSIPKDVWAFTLSDDESECIDESELDGDTPGGLEVEVIAAATGDSVALGVGCAAKLLPRAVEGVAGGANTDGFLTGEGGSGMGSSSKAKNPVGRPTTTAGFCSAGAGESFGDGG